MQEQETILAEKYIINEKIGSGAFGEVFRGRDIKTEKLIAIKVEPSNTKHPQLIYEAKLYQYLIQNSKQFDGINLPNIYFIGQYSQYNIMVMDILGPSLKDLLILCGNKFSLKTVLQVFDQILQNFKYIHSQQIIYRSVKPSNFLIGKGEKQGHVFLIDLGYAKRIKQENNNLCSKGYRENIASLPLASINFHLAIPQTLRDDLESIGYMMIQFLQQNLPWQNLPEINQNAKQKYERIVEKKLQTKVEEICYGLPQEFAIYLNYCRNLKWEDKPDYDYLIKLFRDLFINLGYKYDGIFDWTEIMKKNEMKEQ